ncbi:hypothetical protein BCV72DRAFT_317792 [Rhizopus microsporus var. microsporus]|uniref:Uncharacterized protein n=1 Tax=Rhizopus microsporus var. microsporus TaxID=86635 RepID=A0A1X0QRT6_RHIZD|nr:hypothetical protein BCV72DRAFT_317792 [Rhizopus microsporus var. microsporus]
MYTHIPDNLCYSAQTEWSDSSKSDVTCVPKSEVSDALPLPILIEIQNCVDQSFLSSLIRYCTHVYGRYKMLSVVLAIAVKCFSSVDFETEFVTDNSEHLSETGVSIGPRNVVLFQPNQSRNT